MPSKIGMAAALVFCAVFAGIGLAALGDGALPQLDRSIAHKMMTYDDEHPLTRTLMIGFTHAGGVWAMMTLAILGIGWSLARRRYALAVAWFVVVAGGALLNQGLKVWLDRDRPAESAPGDITKNSAVTETNESFPSGHAMGSLLGYGMLCYVLCLSTRLRRVRVSLICATGVLVVFIGLSRIFLRAHWFSDVVAGFALGIAWLSLILWLLETRRPAAEPAPSLAPEMAQT